MPLQVSFEISLLSHEKYKHNHKEIWFLNTTWKRCLMLLFLAAWTTVMPCTQGSQRKLYNNYNLFRMLQQGSSLEQEKVEHIPPVLRYMHWLPISFRILFKIILLVFKLVDGCGLNYISQLLILYKPTRTLRTSENCVELVLSKEKQD